MLPIFQLGVALLYNCPTLSGPYLVKSISSFFLRDFSTMWTNTHFAHPYQWWYTIGLRTNEDLYTGALFLLFLSALSLIGGWLHLQPKWKPGVY